MSRSFGLWGMAAAVVLGLGLFSGMGSTARAGEATHCIQYQYITVCKYVTCYETHLEPYTKWVTYYDSCGCPHTVARTCYRGHIYDGIIW